MLVKYTRLEEPEDFKRELARDASKALKISNKINSLLGETISVLEKNHLSAQVATEVNLLTLGEVEKLMNFLLLLKANLEHFDNDKQEEESQKELLTEEPQNQLGDLISKLEGMANLDKK
jgi:hypothetical protein